MCRRVLLVVLWLLIGTRSRLLVVGLLSITEALCPSLCLFGTILVTLCLMVWDWRVSRKRRSALSLLSPAVLSFSSFHGLVVWGWGLWTDRVSPLSPGLAQRTQKKKKIILLKSLAQARMRFFVVILHELQFFQLNCQSIRHWFSPHSTFLHILAIFII